VYQGKADLSHPGPKPVHDLLIMIDVKPSILSQQLSVLSRPGLVSSREGSLTVYSLSTPDVVDLLALARRILAAMLSDRDGLPLKLPTGQRS
jgi:DNA-binding transcriptional ArsR family regulator